jgi:hypothetical protein
MSKFNTKVKFIKDYIGWKKGKVLFLTEEKAKELIGKKYCEIVKDK